MKGVWFALVCLGWGTALAEEEGLRVMEFLEGFGESLFGAPDSKTGDAVAGWGPQSQGNPEELGAYPEGDILFPSSAASRNGLKEISARWPKGVVPYVITGSFSQKDLNFIDRAMQEYHKLTCIR
jgi:hypothetical protein